MLKLYRMPSGRVFQFEDKDVPAEAVLLGQKKKEAPKNKAVRPKNKAVRK